MCTPCLTKTFPISVYFNGLRLFVVDISQVSAAESLDPRKLRMNVARLKRALSGRSPLLAESIWRIGVLLPLIAR